MIEVSGVRQIPGEPKRRWFSSPEFDLFVHCAEGGSGFVGFQLCYDKPQREHAIIYREGEGFRHMVVDDGEQRPGKYKASPMLCEDGVFDAARIYVRFCEASTDLPADVAAYVRLALARHPNFRGAV